MALCLVWHSNLHQALIVIEFRPTDVGKVAWLESFLGLREDMPRETLNLPWNRPFVLCRSPCSASLRYGTSPVLKAAQEPEALTVVLGLMAWTLVPRCAGRKFV